MTEKGLFPCEEGWLSQEYSPRHRGIDIGWHEIPHIAVRAWKDGVCIASGKDPNGSVYAVLRHKDGRWSGYWHMSDDTSEQQNYIKQGTAVKEGDTVGIRDCTGYATGVHLHFLITAPGMPEQYNYRVMEENTVDPLELCYKRPSDYIENRLDDAQLDLPVVSLLPKASERNESLHQVEVYATALRCRKGPSLTAEIIDFIPQGIYTVLEETEADGYVWARIGEGEWIATNEAEGWTRDLPAREDAESEAE